MADDTIKIDVKTTSDTSGLDKTAKALDNVSKASGSSAKSAADSANKHKVFGDVLRNVVTGNINGAITAAQSWGVKVKDIGGVLMAATAAIGIWASNIKKWISAANETKKLDIEDSIRNTAGNAQMLAQNMERSATAISSLSEQEKSVQSLEEATRNLTMEIERQNIANERARELAAATDDLQRQAINIKYDKQLAGVDSRAGKQGVEDEKKRIEQQALDLQRENELLKQSVLNNGQMVGKKLNNAQMLAEQGDDEQSFWKTGVWNRGTRIANSKSFYEKQGAEIDSAGELNQDSRAKLDQIKANEAKIAALQEQVAKVIPLKEQLASAKDTGTQIGIAGNVGTLYDDRAKQAKEAAAAQAEEEARARALSDAQYQRDQLAAKRDVLLGSADPARAAANEAGRASALAQGALAQGQARWAGSRNTTMRDKDLGPLIEQANTTASQAAAAEASLQRALKTSNEAVKAIDKTIREFDSQIARLGNHAASARGDLQE